MELCTFVEPQEGATYSQLLAMATATERAGLHGFFRSDHYQAFGGDGLPGPTDAWITLAGLARETSRIRLGTLVTSATFRRPGPLAIAVAQVDQMSGGRVDLGLGAGWFDREHASYGIPFLDGFGARFQNLEEQLAIITGLWATPAGERFSFAGEQHTVIDSPALPKPAQTPHPPIILGGGGPVRTPALAARFATEFNTPFLDVAGATAQFARVRAACEAAGRDPATMAFSAAVTVCAGIDEAEVARRAAAIGRTPEQMGGGGVAGTPAQVAERFLAYREAGASRIYMQLLDIDDLDHVALLAEAVAPLLQPAGGGA